MQHCFLQHQTSEMKSFLHWPSRFILFGAISNCPPLSPSSILDTSDLGGSSSSVKSFCLFVQFMKFSWQEYWSDLPFHPPADHVLSELFTMTYLSWEACTIWLIFSLYYPSPFATTRL